MRQFSHSLKADLVTNSLAGKRFRFAIGIVVMVRGDLRWRRRIIKRRYMYQPPKNDVYWLDKPVSGLTYFNGDDLIRARPTGKAKARA